MIMKGSKVITILAVGAGLVGAAGTLFLYGKNGPKNRKKIKGWALKAKGEVLEKLETLSEVSEDTYNTIVDEVMKRYELAKNIDQSELLALAKELKGHWRSLKKSMAAPAEKASLKKGKK